VCSQQTYEVLRDTRRSLRTKEGLTSHFIPPQPTRAIEGRIWLVKENLHGLPESMPATRRAVGPGQRPALVIYRKVLQRGSARGGGRDSGTTTLSRRAAASDTQHNAKMKTPDRICKPDPVPPEGEATVIPLGRPLLVGSSDHTRGSVAGRRTLLFGLAPSGVCRASRLSPGSGELLPHRFTRAGGASPRAVCFLWHFPRLATGRR